VALPIVSGSTASAALAAGAAADTKAGAVGKGVLAKLARNHDDIDLRQNRIIGL